MLGLVEAADQEQAPDLEIARVRGVHPVAVRLERRPCRGERLRRPAQAPRGQRDLALGADAPRAGHGLSRTEGTGRASYERLRSHEIAELRHRDAAQRERRRIVAQRDPVQRAERITRGERTRRRRDQRVHRNPATLVTPTVRSLSPIYPTMPHKKERNAMTTHAIGTHEDRLAPAARGAADWVCLAAAPTFAIMALLTGVLGGGPQEMLCAAATPLSGMVPMYMLMSAFHSGPWLKLISSRRSGARRSRR